MLPFFIAGLVLILFSAHTLRQLLFPIAFLIFLAPPPVEILYGVGSTLSVLSSEASNALVNLFGIPSSISNEYGNPILTITRQDHTIMNFTVDVACSGIYSLLGFAIFAIFVAYITRGKIQNKLAILIMGIPLIIALNIIRIATIQAIGYHYGEQLALQVFHTLDATMLMFLGTLLLLGIKEKLFQKLKPQQPCTNCNPTMPKTTDEFCPNCGKLLRLPKVRLRRSDLAKIATTSTIIGLLLLIHAPVFALTEGPAQVIIQTTTGAQGNTHILPQIPGYTLEYVYRDHDFEQLSGQDASLTYAYSSNNTTIWTTVEIASTPSFLHRWEGCLIIWPLHEGCQPRVNQLDLRDIQIQDNPPILARYFAFQYCKTNQTQVVLYWHTTSAFTVNGTSQQKQVKISLIAYPKTIQDVRDVENLLVPFAKAVIQYWQPIQTWSQITLMLSQNGFPLSTVTFVLLIALILYKLVFSDRRERISLQTLYTKLPEEHQLIVQAVSQASKDGSAITPNIAKHLQKLTRTNITTDWLTEKLQQAETSGLIEKKIANTNDIPVIVWKNRINLKTTMQQPKREYTLSRRGSICSHIKSLQKL